MGIKSFKCTRCGHNNIGNVMKGDRCSDCKLGRYAAVEVIPDEYYTEIKGRGYRLKLEQLKKMFEKGEISRVQFLAFKNDLDRRFPNPKVDWRRLPKSFKQIQEIDDYEDEPEVKIHVPQVRMLDENTIGISTKEMELGTKDEEGEINWSRVNEIRQKSRNLLDKFTSKRKKRP